jgi:GH25 family lysozyme M1 (1,4-beta-N-acetylmuramidase)
MTEGLDVYGRYNNVTNWGAVKAAKSFVWIKVSDGTSTANGLGTPYDYGYAGQASAVGLPAGGYHYAQLGDPVQQANIFINRCEALGLTQISPMLDLESPFVANQAAINFAIAFCNQVLARGHTPTLYANNSMLLTVRGPFKAAVPLSWINVARYGANPTVPWDVWQKTSSGTCSGVVGNVDLDTGTYPNNVSATQDWIDMATQAEVQQAVHDGVLSAMQEFYFNIRYADGRNWADEVAQTTGSLLGLQSQTDELITAVNDVKDAVNGLNSPPA